MSSGSETSASTLGFLLFCCCNFLVPGSTGSFHVTHLSTVETRDVSKATVLWFMTSLVATIAILDGPCVVAVVI